MYSFYYYDYIRASTNEKINIILTPVGPVNYSKPNQISHIITLPIPIYYLTQEELDSLKTILFIKFPYQQNIPIPFEKHQEIKDKQNYLMDNLFKYGSLLPNSQQQFQQQQQQPNTFTQYATPDQSFQPFNNENQQVEQINNNNNNNSNLNNNNNKNDNMTNEPVVNNNDNISDIQHQQNIKREFQTPSIFSYNNFRNHIVNHEHSNHHHHHHHHHYHNHQQKNHTEHNDNIHQNKPVQLPPPIQQNEIEQHSSTNLPQQVQDQLSQQQIQDQLNQQQVQDQLSQIQVHDQHQTSIPQQLQIEDQQQQQLSLPYSTQQTLFNINELYEFQIPNNSYINNELKLN